MPRWTYRGLVKVKRLATCAVIALVCVTFTLPMVGCMPRRIIDSPAADTSGRHHYDEHHHGNGYGSSGAFDSWQSGTPGSFDVPDGWVVADAHSSQDKVFYVEAGDENAPMPDNVSVNYGTNRYAKDDHESFRQAILRQLGAQTSGADVGITGSGEHTPAGDVLYVITVEEEDCTTTFCYVVGDYEFCLFQATDFDGSTAAANAARAMANTFSWQ